MGNLELIKKADLALSDLTSDGGLLLPDQSTKFIRTLIEKSSMLNQVRTVQMNSPKQNISKVKFGSRILQPASQDTTASTATHAGRYLTEAARSKVTTSEIQLSTKEVMAEVQIPYEVLEDNIERDQFTNTILALIAEKASADLEELMLQGDTASADVYLKLTNGVLKLATSNVVDALGDPMDAFIASSVAKAMPKQFRGMTGLQHYITSDAAIDLRTAIANRNTVVGDLALTTSQPISLHGKKASEVMKMPTGYSVYTDPKNIVFGIQRQIRIEQDRDIRSRNLIFVLTARVDFQLEEETAVVKTINLAS